MGIMDAINPEIKIEVKFSDLYNLVKNSTKAEMMLNGIKNEVDHDSIYKIVTGKPLHESVCENKESEEN